MSAVLIDSNVILNAIFESSPWSAWSSRHLEALARQTRLVINPIIFAEVSVSFPLIEDAEAAMSVAYLEREQISYDAAFLAGKAYLAYRRRGGERRSPLPDFFIGAHAAVAGYELLTRDASRYRTYFPRLAIVAPDTHP